MKYISILILILSLSVCTVRKTVKEEPFTVDVNSPKVSLGSVEAQFDKTLGIGGLRQVELKAEYYPLEDAVALQYRLDFTTYNLCWSRDGREAFIKALEQYKEEFDQRLLSAKGSKKTRTRYGKIEGYLMWQSFSFSARARASVDIELGYDVKSIDIPGAKKPTATKVPFFTILQNDTIFLDEMTTEKDGKTTQKLEIYLTKAKADELVELFNQEILDQLVPEQTRRMLTPIAPDEYF
jgi:hypothetical protein